MQEEMQHFTAIVTAFSNEDGFIFLDSSHIQVIAPNEHEVFLAITQWLLTEKNLSDVTIDIDDVYLTHDDDKIRI